MLTVLPQEKKHSLALVHYGNRQNFKFKQVEFSSKKEISNPKRKDDHNQDCCSFSFCHLRTNSDVAQTLQCQLCNGMLCSNSNPKHIWVYLEHSFKLFPLQTPENRNLVLQSHFVNIFRMHLHQPLINIKKQFFSYWSTMITTVISNHKFISPYLEVNSHSLVLH